MLIYAMRHSGRLQAAGGAVFGCSPPSTPHAQLGIRGTAPHGNGAWTPRDVTTAWGQPAGAPDHFNAAATSIRRAYAFNDETSTVDTTPRLPPIHLSAKFQSNNSAQLKRHAQSTASPAGSLTASGASPKVPPDRSQAASRLQFADPGQSLMFFDYDDTLFPTTLLFEDWGFPLDPQLWVSHVLTAQQGKELRAWRNAVYAYLRTACSRGRVVIVTNAKRPWVQLTVEFFAPKLKSLLDLGGGPVRVVYAQESPRGAQSRSHGLRPVKHSSDSLPDSEAERTAYLTAVKTLAMKREVESFYSRYPGQTWKNILSWGDADFEHDAVQAVTFEHESPAHEQVRTKAIIVPLAETLSEFTWGLRFSQTMLVAFVAHDGDLDLDLRDMQRLEHVRASLQALELPEPSEVVSDQEFYDELVVIIQNSMFE